MFDPPTLDRNHGSFNSNRDSHPEETVTSMIPTFLRLRSDRIGELAKFADYYLRKTAAHGKGELDERGILLSEDPINEHLVECIKNEVPVIDNERVIRWLSRFARIPGVPGSFLKSVQFEHNAFQVRNAAPAQLSFTEEQQERGEALLSSMGIDRDSSFVCFNARTPAYLDEEFPERSREEWSYHDFRDSSVERYLDAARYLASIGVPALRMGAVVEKEIDVEEESVIDYASRFRTAFGDIYLSGNCKFFLGDTAGLVCVPQAFGVPVAGVNWIPVGLPPVYDHDLFIPKKLWDEDQERFLTYREIIEEGMDQWFFAEDYKDAGVKPMQNSETEILELAKEMNQRIDGTWEGKKEDEELLAQFRDLFPEDHSAHGFPSRVGAHFLRENSHLIS